MPRKVGAMKYAIAVILFCSTLFAEQTCQLPKKALVNSFTYTCDNAQQQIVWAVIYYQKQAFVALVKPHFHQLKPEAVHLRPAPYHFHYGVNQLSVWFTKDLMGQWIQMEGTR